MADDAPKNKNTVKSYRRWRRARQVVQILALLLFLYLLLGTTQEGATFLPQNLFFRLDPLAGISAMFAGRSWIAPLALGGIITLFLTLVLGRVWCGWLCPLGTLLDWTPSRRPRRERLDIPSCWRQVKHVVLFTILLAALLGSLTLLIADPITLLFRTITSVVLPAVSFLVTTAETWLYQIGPLQPAVEWFDGLVRGWLITGQPFFWPNLLLVLPFVGILALNAIRPRFWCRYLCPLGALLALVSRIPLLRHSVDEAKCTACQRCAVSCPTGAIDPERKFAARTADCTMCLDCADTCPTGAISFQWQRGLPAPQRYEPSRRHFFASVGAAVLGATLLRVATAFRGTNPLLLRPPGTTDEQLLSKCIRCGECIKVCPTGGLQPSFSTAGGLGLWTPVLIPRLGYCDYSCNSCGQVCPTGAIPKLSLEEKRQKVLGVAVIGGVASIDEQGQKVQRADSVDEQRCIPWAEGLDCIVCEEMCPVPHKAIELTEELVVNKYGEETTVLLPRVVADLCTGCGICEYQCPLEGESAIRIRTVDDFNW